MQTWLAQAIRQLRSAGNTSTPELDAQLILSHVLDITRTKIVAFPETTISGPHSTQLQALLQRRLDGEPVAYLTGKQNFWNAELVIQPGTLVPRADTEILIEKALELEPRAPAGAIADLGTGSGAIAIAIAGELPLRQILAVEFSAAALANARLNIGKQRAGNVQLMHASWLDAVASHSLGMILSNPPYLAMDDIHLAALKHEPHEALVGGAIGLDDIERIVVDSVRAAKHGAPLVIEHGFEQGAAVRSLLTQHGYTGVDTARDLAGHERVSFGFAASSS